MALLVTEYRGCRLTAEALAAWADVPASIVSDEINRTGTMTSAIGIVAPGMRCVGQALTVQLMVGDNAPLHYAVTLAWPGAVLVADGRGHPDTAVWGGILTAAATRRGVGGVVVDGAVRDVAEVRRARIAVFARGVVPNGPHKGFGGSIGAQIQCGGVSVASGDLVIGDDDGVVVLPLAQVDALLPRCQARMAKEADMLEQIGAGKTTVELIGLPAPSAIG
ncbi:MAG: RraA family protein [Alphaproteobacteria bacterium]|nr:RraA family protein [Alphaproteobacteria bacterium]